MSTGFKLSIWSGGALVLLLGAWLYVSDAEREARDLAIAEEREKQAQVQDAERQKLEAAAKAERDQHEAERLQWAEQQAALARSLAARNQSVDKLIAAALTPKTQAQIADDAKQTLGIAPPVLEGGFKLSLAEMQAYVGLKLDRDRLAENLKETTLQLELERQSNATLRADLDKAVKTIEMANRTISDYQTAMDAYKKVAKRSKWRKFGSVAGKVGIVVLPAIIVGVMTR
jgi:flagellar biosynthesis GTPase FlhF